MYFNDINCVNSSPWSGEEIIGMHFVRMSVCMSVIFRVQAITNLCIDRLPYNLVQMLSSLRRCVVTLIRVLTAKVELT